MQPEYLPGLCYHSVSMAKGKTTEDSLMKFGKAGKGRGKGVVCKYIKTSILKFRMANFDFFRK